MQRVLVTGGAGFIGSELVRQLAQQGDEVVVVDNLINGRRENLTGLPADQVRLVQADIRDRPRMAELLSGIQVVYHLACLGVRHSLHSPAENHEVNATATLHLLTLARAAGITRFVSVSSSEVYGTAQWVPMTEAHPTFPMTVYGASKLAGECYARAFQRTHGFATVVVRPFNAFGPRCHHEGDSGEVIPRFLLRCLAGQPLFIFGDGNQTRDFTYVSDAARGIALAGSSVEAVGQTINLGSGAEIAIKDLARQIAEICGRKDARIEHVEPRPGDVLRLCADSTLARDLLGFTPQVSLWDGLRRLLDWYQEQGSSPEDLLSHEVVRNWEGGAKAQRPTSKTVVPLARPQFGEEEILASANVIRSGWVTQGPEVKAFEEEFARCVGAGHACAVSSCTAGLHLALRAVGVGCGDEVITVSHSFIATANVVRYLGAKPVFVDIEPDTFNIDPHLIAPLIGKRTRALLVVHQLGMPCDLSTLVPLAQQFGLPLIEDAACAIGSEILWDGRWERLGKPHGDIACFSFHPRKVLTTGDGGMLTTANPDWDQKFRLWRQHGMSVPDLVRHTNDKVIFETYPELGYNYRMTDIQAAIGRQQLARLPVLVSERRTLAGRYLQLLADIPGLGLPRQPAWARSNWQSFCVRLPDHVEQRAVMQHLLDVGIASRRGVMCSHREASYPPERWSCGASREVCGCSPGACQRLAQSEQAQDRAIILPLFPGMTDDQQDHVIKCLREACGK